MPLVPGYHLKELQEDDEQYGYLRSKMIKTLTQNPNNAVQFESYHIRKAYKVLNSELWERYTARRNEIYLELGRERVFEKRLFHGSPSAKEILKKGFKLELANAGGLFGKGIYFAENSSKSVQYAYGLNNGCQDHGKQSCLKCPRYMMLCRVALGKMLEVTQVRRSSLPSGYHSVHAVPSPGGLLYPEYIVYNNDQVYPGYLIEYTILKRRGDEPGGETEEENSCTIL